MSDNTQDVNLEEEKPNVEDVEKPVGLDPLATDNDTAKKTEGEGESEDPLTRLTADHDTLQKRYKDAERKITELGQDRSDTNRKFDTLIDQVSELRDKLSIATKKPLPSKEEFIASIQEKGVEAIMPYINEPMDAMKSNYEKELGARDEKELKQELKFERFVREHDEINYPGFSKLWPEIQKLARDTNTPVNYDAGVGASLDALYKLVKVDHSGDAILEAERTAKATAEANLAKEANSTVAGGGKKGKAVPMSEADLRKMPIDKLRDAVAGMHGVADRD